MADTLRKELRVKEHGAEEIAFVYSENGPRARAFIGECIDSEGLVRPTIAQTVSLVYSALQNPENEYSRKVIRTLETHGFWGYDEIRYVPDKGAYILDLPGMGNGAYSMNLSQLERKTRDGDPKVRFVQFGYRIGVQNVLDFEKNRFVRGLVGNEGAGKLAEIAGRYKYQPCVWSVKNVDMVTQTGAALGAIGHGNSRLRVGDSGDDYPYRRCAFGLLKKE